MGTSKSYISLKTPAHTAAKRGLTSYLTGGKISKKGVASRFANAVLSEHRLGDVHPTGAKTFTTISSLGGYVGNILGFLSGAQNLGGVSNVVSQMNIQQNIQTPKELFTWIVSSSEKFGTIDSSVVCKAFELTADNLQLLTFDLLDAIDLSLFLKDLLANIVALCFEQRYYEQILQKLGSVEDTKRKVNEMMAYIYGEIVANSDTDDIKDCTRTTEALNEYAERKCMQAFELLKILGYE